MWETSSPKGWLEGDTFGRVVVPFENPDWRLVEFRLGMVEIELGRQLAKLVIQLRVSNATPPHGVLCGQHARKNRGDARIGRPTPVHSQERPRRLALDQFSHIAVHVADLHNEIVSRLPHSVYGGRSPGVRRGRPWVQSPEPAVPTPRAAGGSRRSRRSFYRRSRGRGLGLSYRTLQLHSQTGSARRHSIDLKVRRPLA